MSHRPLFWHHPLKRPHTGVPLSNGRQGVLVWGDDTLLLTVARAGFWDHRNGQTISPEATYPAVRAALESGAHDRLADYFPVRSPGAPFPQQFGGGRLELRFAERFRPLRSRLDPEQAVAEVEIGRTPDEAPLPVLRIWQAVSPDVCVIELPPGSGHPDIRLHAAHSLVLDNAMSALGIPTPEDLPIDGGGGFLQRMPEDDPLALAWCCKGSNLLVATAHGPEAAASVAEILREFDPAAARVAHERHWREVWAEYPRLQVPDAVLQQQWDFGLYKQAGLVVADAPAATLQGPWMEDTRIPPWSNDYHFNINVELVYGPALATGRARHMRPLWSMLTAWLPKMRAWGESFYRVPGALMLPHALDDRGQMMGSFWAGAVDQACVAWMGRMAWDYYTHTGDESHLRDLAFPLLEGAFLGYWGMLERGTGPDGRAVFSLPVSVSPEFGDSDPSHCWGRNASFQLAALHSTIGLLQEAAQVLGRTPDPRWTEVAEGLPPYTLVDAQNGGYGWIKDQPQRIGLWEGKDLTESHRHHSHLAAIHPFATLDPHDPAHRIVVARSLNHWSGQGAGRWTGWCLPWASMICSRCGLPDAARTWLHLLADQFTNEGHATLHNADGAGAFAFDDGSMTSPGFQKGPDFHFYETMQVDAAMGAVSAILELLVSERRGIVHLTSRLPKGWREASVERVRLSGGFELSACWRHGRAVGAVVHSTRGGRFRIAHPQDAVWSIDGRPGTGACWDHQTRPGETLRLEAITL